MIESLHVSKLLEPSPFFFFLKNSLFFLGRHDPRGTVYTDEGYVSRLPSPRVISSNLMLGGNASDSIHSHALMQFGQFLDHDLSANSKGGMHIFPLGFFSPKLRFSVKSSENMSAVRDFRR